MTDPERLFNSGSDKQRALLGAARDLRATSASRQRGLVALGLAAAVTLTPAAALAAAKASQGLGLALVRLLTTYWGAGLVIAGVASGAATVQLLRHPPPHPPAISSASGHPVKSLRAKAAAEPAPAIDQLAPEPSAAPPQEVAADTKLPSRIPKPSELALVDRARQLLAAGNGSAALQALEERARSYPAGALALEASVLRIQSLAATGRRSQARQEARRFLEQHPSGLLSHRVRRLLEEQESP